jgi:hypothetical protein
MPELPETGRRYLGDTARVRLASPGIERYPRRRGPGARVTVAVLVAAALLAAALLLR